VKHAVRAVKPDPAALEFTGRVACLAPSPPPSVAKLNPNPADISAVMGDIARLLDASIKGCGHAVAGRRR
jgi:type I restriction enzyme R subunit